MGLKAEGLGFRVGLRLGALDLELGRAYGFRVFGVGGLRLRA